MWNTPITDRTSADVIEVKRLRDLIVASGWSALTPSEQDYWFDYQTEYINSVLGEQLEGSDSLLLTGSTDVLGNVKGALNYTDLNRIEGNCQYLEDYLAGEGYYIPIVTKLDWVMEDLPYLDEHINRIRYNILALANQFLGTGMIPTITISNYVDYIQVNNWEISLDTILTYLTNMVATYYQCGTLVCGEV